MTLKFKFIVISGKLYHAAFKYLYDISFRPGFCFIPYKLIKQNFAKAGANRTMFRGSWDGLEISNTEY